MSALSSIDRLLLVGLYRLAPEVLDALKIIRPETLIRWHRAGFRAFWRWRSRPCGGRPRTPASRAGSRIGSDYLSDSVGPEAVEHAGAA